ncbi:MAG: response regulator transcription factor [Burkholderiaceae bacterium]|nr:response regulator transcription factor [Burkholderiaceae bacterium]
MDAPVLIVEDDIDTAEQIGAVLRDDGLSFECVCDGREALQRAASGDYRLILLDVLLPGMHGLEVLRQLRLLRVGTPVLMVSARGSEIDRVLGLDLGADDYVCKPVSLVELRARVKALFRSIERLSGARSTGSPTGAPARQSLGALDVDLRGRRVWRGGVEVALSAREFDLLALLIGAPGRVYSRGQLLEAVWHTRLSAYEDNVNTHITRLRHRIEPDPANPRYILTVRGVGYRSAVADELGADRA